MYKILTAFCFLSVLACSTTNKSTEYKGTLSSEEQAYLSFGEFRIVRLSPNEKRFVVEYTTENKTTVSILDRESKEIIGSTFLGKNIQVQDFIWINDNKLIVIGQYVDGYLKGGEGNQFVFTMTAEGKEFHQIFPQGESADKSQYNFSSFRLVSKNLIDGRYLMVSEYKGSSSGMILSLKKLDVERGKLSFVDRVKMKRGQYVVDNSYRPRLAFSVDKKGDITTFTKNLKSDSWEKHNFWKHRTRDLSVLGFNRQNNKFYFLADDKSSRKTLNEAEINEKGQITGVKSVFSYAGGDVLGTIWDRQSFQPLFVEYGNGRPERKYLSKGSTAELSKSLDQAFPGERVYMNFIQNKDNVLVVMSDKRPTSFYLLKNKSKEVVELLSTNEKVRKLPIFPSQAISFKARDGLKIDGFLYKPANWSSNTPLIVNVHGGPFGVRDRWGYVGDTQFFLANGYAVLNVNYRGSSGRGYDYQKAGYGKVGTAMIDDVADGVKWMIEKNLVKKKNTCLWGISYGAYASIQSAIRYPNLYKCAAAFSGLYDWSTILDEGDTRRNEWARTFWEDRLPKTKKEKLAQSPIANTDKLKIDVLVMHGQEDVRCSVTQSRRLKENIEAQNKSLIYKEFPDVGHWFVSDQIQKNQAFEMLKSFLDSHLKAPKPVSMK